MPEPVLLGRSLSLSDLEDVATRGRKVAIAPDALEAMRRSRAAIDAIARQGDDAPRVYGVNTGFGALSETRISAADVRALQRNLVRSHSTGVGPALER
jgi:histidine ammonia-lyase